MKTDADKMYSEGITFEGEEPDDPEFTHAETLMAALAWFAGSFVAFAVLVVLGAFIWVRWAT